MASGENMDCPVKLTPKMLSGLKWFAEHGPVSSLPCDGTAPTRIIRKRLQAAGLVEECGADTTGHRFFAFTKFRVSAAGQEQLQRESA
jgi:hypothetical protein